MELRREGNVDVLEGRKSFRYAYIHSKKLLFLRRAFLNQQCRDSFREMTDSIKTPFPECIKALCANIKLDPHFADFYNWARVNNVPVIVLSSGMTPIIRGLLVHLLGPEGNDIEIVSNDVEARPGKKIEEEGGWQIRFHDESHFGHDKSLAIIPYRKHFDEKKGKERPTMLYAGDGVSDLSAARETDLLFAKKGMGESRINYTMFVPWQI